LDDSSALAVTTTSPDTAVLVLQSGGPDTTRHVRRFIRRMLSDRAILAMPGAVRIPLAAAIALFRAPRVGRQYARIGGGSPIRKHTEAQAARLEEALLRLGHALPVLVGMRYSDPSIEAAVERVRRMGGIRELVLLPLFPQYSGTTTGSAFAAVERAARDVPGLRLVPIPDWADERRYAEAVAGTIDTALSRLTLRGRRRPVVLFSAHGLPVRYVEDGDPYPDRVAATVRAVEEAMGDAMPRHSVCYQSRLGPVKWLEPNTHDAILAAAAEGASAVVLVPIAFVCDHLETLYEMDVEYRAVAEGAGVEFARAPALNDSAELATALAAVVVRALHRQGGA